MRERKLENGWSDRKTKRWFLWVAGLFHMTAWMMDATRYVERLEWELFRVTEWRKADVSLPITVNLDVPGGNFLFGLIWAVVAVLYLAITTVHRESFKENWYVTLRRIPDYRGKYLRAKLMAVLFPVAIYAVYGILQWSFQRSMYRSRVPEALRIQSAWTFSVAEEVLLPVISLVLFAISVLLLNFVLRNVKKDIIGGFAAIGGIGLPVFCSNVINFPELWQRVVALSGVIGIEVLFLVRHVYRKL